MAKATEKSAEQPKPLAANAAQTLETSPSPDPVAAREQIELRAYEIYLQRGCLDGLDVQDWLQAESELIAEGENAAARAKAAGV